MQSGINTHTLTHVVHEEWNGYLCQKENLYFCRTCKDRDICTHRLVHIKYHSISQFCPLNEFREFEYCICTTKVCRITPITTCTERCFLNYIQEERERENSDKENREQN